MQSFIEDAKNRVGQGFQAAGNGIAQGVGQVAGKVAKTTGHLSADTVKNKFTRQIYNWAPADFIQHCKNKNGGGVWDPADDTLKPYNQGELDSLYLNEEQACKFVEHFIYKWKARNRSVIQKFKPALCAINLGDFERELKNALDQNQFTSPFLLKNYNLRGDWFEIFNVVEYDEAACKATFKKICDNNGRLYWKDLDAKVVQQLAGSIGTATMRLF